MISDSTGTAGAGVGAAAWWRVAAGVTWIQCQDPATVERVRKLRGARLVARGVNVYLRTYEVAHPVGWVEALMTKPQNPPSNRAFFLAKARGGGREAGMVSK